MFKVTNKISERRLVDSEQLFFHDDVKKSRGVKKY